jgi:hypothetical protein
MTSPRYKTTQWSGRDNFECTLCPFKTLDRGRMVNHVRAAHPTESEVPDQPDELEDVPFASASAYELAREKGLTFADFVGKTPTGSSGGFVRSDVSHIASTTTEE